jgi:hypothetical protein
MNMSNNIITGERIQEIADVYIGTEQNFQYNPRISIQYNKQKKLSDFTDNMPYDNPSIVFCYGDSISQFNNIKHLLKNPFVFISHNSDLNMTDNPLVNEILNCPNLIRWHSQNVDYKHEKLHLIPIGIANSMWPHGNLRMFDFFFHENKLMEKTQNVYMNFKIETNWKKRSECYNSLCKKVEFLQTMSPFENLYRLKQYKYCICPEGNGIDTHRLWEAYYLKIVPILLRSVHTEIIQKMGLPMVLLDSWDDFDEHSLPRYESFDFSKSEQFLNINYYIETIRK